MNHHEKTYPHDTKHIVFFDGVCNLCNSSVDILMRLDKHKSLKFSSLQGDYFKDLDLGTGYKSMDSIILYSDGEIFHKSDAVLEIFRLLGFPYSLLSIFVIIPSFIRDSIYDFIARNRYKWFGKKNICRLPTKEEQERFI